MKNEKEECFEGEGEGLILFLCGAVVMSPMAGICVAVILLLKNQHPFFAFLAALAGGIVSWGFFILTKRVIRKQDQAAREAARIRTGAKIEEEFQQPLAASTKQTAITPPRHGRPYIM